MNNYYTLLSLVAELNYKISGKIISEILSWQKDRMDLFFSGNDEGKLTYHATSPHTALFHDSRAARPSRNSATFFPELASAVIETVRMAVPDDRFVLITFRNRNHQLLFQPFSSRPNLFLIHDNVIISSFKQSRIWQGKPSPLNAIKKSTEKPESDKTGMPPASVRSRILAMDKKFPRRLIDDVSQTCRLSEKEPEQFQEIINTIRQHLLKPASVGITAEGQICLLPDQYLTQTPAKRFSKVNDAVRYLAISRIRSKKWQPGKEDLLKKIEKKTTGLARQLDSMERDTERLQKADYYEKAGHMLMAQPDASKPATTVKIRLEGWDNDRQSEEIRLHKGKTLIENAQDYYNKASDIRKAGKHNRKLAEELKKRMEQLDRWAAEIRKMEQPAEFNNWLKIHNEQLIDMGIALPGAAPQHRPYHRYRLGQYEVWIGKNARSNDQVLARSHKEDIWMHVRSASGSHLVIRNNARREWPDKNILRQAAGWAAASSGESGASLVPVMMAKRKHVRKPRGAAPGQVLVTREKVELVPPEKPADSIS